MMTRVILDCDTATDDAVAIMLAALHPGLDLVAVTTVNGNVPVHLCTDNSLRVLDHIGRGAIPVYEGAASPLARVDFPVPRAGSEPGHGEHLDIPPPGLSDAVSPRCSWSTGSLALAPTGTTSRSWPPARSPMSPWPSSSTRRSGRTSHGWSSWEAVTRSPTRRRRRNQISGVTPRRRTS